MKVASPWQTLKFRRRLGRVTSQSLSLEIGDRKVHQENVLLASYTEKV